MSSAPWSPETPGQLMLRDPLATSGRASAIGRAHIVRQDDRRVWLFDGSAAA